MKKTTGGPKDQSPQKDRKFATAKSPRLAKHTDNSPTVGRDFLNREELKAVAPIYNEIDNAAQTALYPMGGLNPYGAKAKDNLARMFSLDDAAATKLATRLGDYHGLKIGRMYAQVDALAEKKGNVSREETHQFFSVIYHMLDEPDALLEGYRASIKSAMGLLNMGEPLSIEQLKQCQQKIERFTGPQTFARFN